MTKVNALVKKRDKWQMDELEGIQWGGCEYKLTTGW
jgi:hypothetical protein